MIFSLHISRRGQTAARVPPAELHIFLLLSVRGQILSRLDRWKGGVPVSVIVADADAPAK